MKKLFMIISIFILFNISAYAANGDIAGEIYTTDILTQVDGRDIPSYSLNGETLIALEDLEQYGFNVKYYDSIRTVFINNDGEAEKDFNPTVERGKVGGIAGYYYESDIVAYVNGINIAAYSLDGKMAAKVEDLGRSVEDNHYQIDLRSCSLSPYLMSYEYNDEKRLLSLYTGKSRLPSPDVMKSQFENYDDGGWWFFSEEIKLDGGRLLIGGQSGTTHGTYYHLAYVGDDRLYIPLHGIFAQFRFNSVWGNLRAYDFEADGDCIKFKGIKSDGREGVYRLNPRTFDLDTLEESEPDESKSSEWNFPESPLGKEVLTSPLSLIIDGCPVQAYVGMDMGEKKGSNRTLIDIDVLTHFGFSKTFAAENLIVYNKTGEADKSWKDTVREPWGAFGTVEAFGGVVAYINGHGLTLYKVNGKYLADVDYLWALHYRKGAIEWDLYNQYGISEMLISGVYDDETNTLTLDTSGRSSAKLEDLKETVKNLFGNDPEIPVIPEVMTDTENEFIMKYTFNPKQDGATCFRIVSDGEYAKAYEINWYFNILSIWEIVDFECDGEDIIAIQQNGAKHRLNTKTFEITQE